MVKKPTEEQRDILRHKGNVVVTAKPGSGKTYTIVEKIARVIPDLPEYKGVIAISFTNKASDELKKRCNQRCADTKRSFFGTIDKFYISQIIIPFSSHITGNVTKYDIIGSEDIDESSKYAPLLEESFASKKYDLLIEGLQEGKIFLKYTGETALYILEDVPGAMQYIKARYSHIIIDEYQDCGEIQDKVFIKLVENGVTGIAVGDIYQAIYGFTNRFPKYLIALMKRDDFAHFELSKNHRCHPSISEYSLCLFGASKTVPSEKRVFKVDISGNERNIAAAIDKYLDKIKDKYSIVRNNQIAILCRSNSTASKMGENLRTPCKIFKETVLDKDNSEWGRFFRDLISARFDESIFAVDYAEQLFSEELEPKKYRKALALCQSIFSNSFDDFCNAEDKITELAGMVYTQKETEATLNNLHLVISDPQQLKNYVPARENELNIMTLHKSKGLEFNIVFHMDMYKWIIPNEFGDESSVQQDLNLHYVGLTRAKDACYIMKGTSRFRSRRNDYTCAEPSPFLSIQGLADRRKDVGWKL